ncbi:MAG: rod shape-determining protein MreC [Bacteroidaceae bacterium]|nr:rod shape-determining protein MreC [Bacteroidaceae bacterium]
MQQLFDFLRRWSHVFLFVVLEVVSGVLLFRFNHYQGSVYLSAANGVNAEVAGWYTDVESFFHLRENNASLTARNLTLERENAALRRALEVANHRPDYTEQRIGEQLAAYEQVQATVVSNAVRTPHNYIVIDRGEADGIKPDMGVVSGGGVAGIVCLTAPHHSLVMPLIHPKSSLSCRIRGQGYFGYLQWDGASTHHAYLDDVPRYAKIRKGMVVETSGYSAVFPPGLFVGRVTTVENAADGQGYRLRVNLGTNFSALRDVAVITTPYKAEIDTLKKNALFNEEATH